MKERRGKRNTRQISFSTATSSHWAVRSDLPGGIKGGGGVFKKKMKELKENNIEKKGVRMKLRKSSCESEIFYKEGGERGLKRSSNFQFTKPPRRFYHPIVWCGTRFREAGPPWPVFRVPKNHQPRGLSHDPSNLPAHRFVFYGGGNLS